MFNELISAFLSLPIANAFDVEPPISHENNTWYVEDVAFSHIINSTSEVNASFLIYRSYYQECIPKAPDGLEKLLVCGWIIVNSPLSCYITIHEGTGKSNLTNPSQERWHTCHERPKAVESERILSEDEKQWIKWRSFNLHELDVNQLNKDDLHQGPFRNVSFEFVNGIRNYRNGSRLPIDQIRVIKTTFSSPNSWMDCWYPGAPFGIKPADDQWYCRLKNARAVVERGFYCTGMIGLAPPCGFLISTSESFISLSDFKKSYN